MYESVFVRTLYLMIVCCLISSGMAEESCQKQIALNQYFPGMDDVLSVLGTTGIINTRFKEEGSSVVQNENGTSFR